MRRKLDKEELRNMIHSPLLPTFLVARRARWIMWLTYGGGCTMLSSSDGEVRTLRIVSFRPFEEPMPIDARERIETESGSVRTWVCPFPSENTIDAQLAAGG